MASTQWQPLARFARRIPDSLIAAMDPGARAPTEDLREAVTWALVFTAMTVIVAMSTSILSGLYDALAGREILIRTGRFSAFLRKLLAMAIIFLPWYSVIDLIKTGSYDDALVAFAFLGAVGWMTLRAADHGRIWLESDERLIKIQRGFAIFPVKLTTVDLSVALIDATTRTPVGKQVKGRPVYIAKRNWDLVVKALGGTDEASAWLRGAVAKVGLVAAGRRFVAGS